MPRHLIGSPEQGRLFDDGYADVTVPVRLTSIRIERSRQFSDVYLALALFRGTGLEELCESLVPQGKEQVGWSKMISVLVAVGLCEPTSELHIAQDWYRRTALSDLLQLPAEQVKKDRLYRALDELLPHKGAIEAHLSRRCGELFSMDHNVLLYDVTSTYFDSRTVQSIVNTMEARHGVIGCVWSVPCTRSSPAASRSVLPDWPSVSSGLVALWTPP